MKHIPILAFLLIASSCTATGDNNGGNGGGNGGGGDTGNLFGSLIYSDAKQWVGLNAASDKKEVMDQNAGMPILGNSKSRAFRIPAILTKPGYTFVTADMRYGVPADSAHNIDSVIRRSSDNGNTWEGMRMIQEFDDFAKTNVTENRGGNYSSVAESASFIDPAIMVDRNGDLLTLSTTFPWNSGLMGENKGRGISGLASYFKSGNDIYMKLRYGVIPEVNGGNTWKTSDSSDPAYTYAVKVSSFGANGRNPILNRDLSAASGDQANYEIDTNLVLYRNGTPLSNDQYLTGRPNNTKVKVSPAVKVQTHLFYSASLFHPVPTSYIFLARSTVNGNTWSKPIDITWQFDNSPANTLNPNNRNNLSSASFLGVSPGIGYTIKQGSRMGRLLVALQKSPSDKGSGCSAFSIYSDDNGVTWTSGETVSALGSTRRSESQYIEAPDNQLLLVHRTGTVVAYSTSLDGGATWKKITEPVDAAGNKIKNTGSDGFGVMVGAANLRQVHYFNQPMFALSLATASGRRAGKVYVGYLQKNRETGDWDMNFDIDGNVALPFNPNAQTEAAAYSSVAELNDGSIGLFYEGAGYGGGGTGGSTISFAKYKYQ